MTREERDEAAISYIKSHRKIDEDLHDLAPRGSVSFLATEICLKYWDKAINAMRMCTPCDLCRYAPASSTDGKPCTMCPAERKEE